MPFHELGMVQHPRKLRQLAEVFESPDFVFMDSRAPEVAMPHAASLGLVPVLGNRGGSAILHVFGGGFFNERWGETVLNQLEATLRTFCPERYIISGQQFEPAFAMRFALHAQRFCPEIIGCRDLASVEALRAVGLQAEFSGDDTFEEMERAAVAVRSAETAPRSPFALHLNLSGYTRAADPGNKGGRLDSLDEVIALLHQRFGADGPPLLVNAFVDFRPEVVDCYGAIPQTIFSELFASANMVDLAGSLLRGELAGPAGALARASRLITSSYHTALFGKMVGIPTYLLAFNTYYDQKKAALREPVESLAAFLDSDPMRRVLAQDQFVSELREARRAWRSRLEAVLASEPSTTTGRSRAEQRWARANADLEASRVELSEERVLRDQLLAKVADLSDREATHLAQIADLLGALTTARVALREGENVRLQLESRLAATAGAEAEIAREAERLRHAAAEPPPLRHQLADAVNNRLKRAGGSRVHRAIKRALDHS